MGNRLPAGRLAIYLFGVSLSVICGCGSQVGEALFLSAAYPVSCEDDDRAGQLATDRVVIDWSGGASDLSDGAFVEGLDFAAFELSGGGTLAEVSDEFISAVRDEVGTILCSLPAAAVNVSNGESTQQGNVTSVLVAQTSSPNAPGQIGEGDYDPCNVVRANEAIIFGDEVLALAGPFSVDEWVRMFANVIAHEVGHTLGYGHIDRAESQGRDLHVELMLAIHTVPEMIRSQRYLADDSNCPVEEDSSAGKRVLSRGYTCSLERE
jgi:hypothetical protein